MPDDLLLSIRRTPAYKQRDRAGLVVAVWKNGVVIRANKPELMGGEYVRGQLDQNRLADLLNRADALGLQGRDCNQTMIVDAAAYYAFIAFKDESRLCGESVPVRTGSPIESLLNYALAIPLDGVHAIPAAQVEKIDRQIAARIGSRPK